MFLPKHTFLITGALAVLAIGMFFGNWTNVTEFMTESSYAQQDDRTQRAISHADELSQAFQLVSAQVRPSVVSIRSIQKIRSATGSRHSRPDVPDELLRRFFGDDFEKFFEHQSPHGGFSNEGLGSGVIISENGFVLTNNHVVRRANEVTVTLTDGRDFEAKVIGTDEKTDLAVLKIEATDLQPAPLGNSDAVEVGQWVLAIGSPFNYHQTVTAGIVSAKGRAVGVADYEDFIQTDAAINPGNSGGPLVNLHGEVIGINTAIASRSGGFNGLGFSIPSNMVHTIYDAIVKHGHVQRGKLGVLIQELDKGLSQSFGFDSTDGVLVGDVLPNSPAHEAGLQQGDIIVSLNEKNVKGLRKLRNAIAATAPGTPIQLGVFREGRHLNVEVTLVKLEDQIVPEELEEKSPEELDLSEELGLNVETLSEEQADKLNIDMEGVLINSVQPGSIADRVQLRRGNVILSVGNTRVHTSDDFRAAMAKGNLEQGVRLQILTGSVRRFVFIKR